MRHCNGGFAFQGKGNGGVWDSRVLFVYLREDHRVLGARRWTLRDRWESSTLYVASSVSKLDRVERCGDGTKKVGPYTHPHNRWGSTRPE